jgi:hypothetical protein
MKFSFGDFKKKEKWSLSKRMLEVSRFTSNSSRMELSSSCNPPKKEYLFQARISTFSA